MHVGKRYAAVLFSEFCR